MAEIGVREAVLADLPQIAAVALAAGQDEEWGGAGAAYMTHLLTHGRVVVGLSGGSVVGFGATRAIGRCPGAVSMLCDLFVDPGLHGSGCGRAMLAELWPGRGRRMTFSSLHGHALPLYMSFGLDAWWPLLYLRGRVDAPDAPDGWRAEPATPAEVAALELAWTGVDRSDDHLAWSRRPNGVGLLARRGGQVMAGGTAGGADGEYGLTHLALAPSGRCWPRAGGWRSLTCTWRPSPGCLTRAGRCRPRRWPERRSALTTAAGHALSPSLA